MGFLCTEPPPCLPGALLADFPVGGQSAIHHCTPPSPFAPLHPACKCRCGTDKLNYKPQPALDPRPEAVLNATERLQDPYGAAPTHCTALHAAAKRTGGSKMWALLSSCARRQLCAGLCAPHALSTSGTSFKMACHPVAG